MAKTSVADLDPDGSRTNLLDLDRTTIQFLQEIAIRKLKKGTRTYKLERLILLQSFLNVGLHCLKGLHFTGLPYCKF